MTQTETTIFHYDYFGRLIGETDVNGDMVAEYVYLGDQLLAMIKPGELVYYFHNDHLGTPQVLTNEGQNISWKAAYTAFGQAAISVETVENPFRFPGQYYDTETGLHYNYFRYYDPTTGRYITPDPIGLEGGINLFAYVESNPLNWVDLLGLKSFSFDEIKKLVNANNHSNQSDELIICIIWNESGFDPSKPHAGGMARGLMGIIQTGGLGQVNKNIAASNKKNKTDRSTYSWEEMNDPSKNIQVGSEYVKWVSERPGDFTENIKYKYGTGATYPAEKILECEKCLKEVKCNEDPTKCLEKVHK